MTPKLVQINELEKVLCNNESTDKGVLDFFDKFKLTQLLSPFESVKIKGYRISLLLAILCLFRLRGMSIWANQKINGTKMFEGDENSLYRLMNNSKMNWRKLLLSFTKQFIHITEKHGEETKSVKCFVLDDTDLEKTGKTIERIGKIFNHVTRKHILGFKLLTLSYWDGKNLIPVDFSLHREKGNSGNFGMSKKELQEQFSKKRDKGASNEKRLKELDKEKPDVAISMLKRAIKNGLKVKYILFDSWFTSDKMIKSIRSIKDGMLHVLGMCKMDNRKFTINKNEYNSKQIIVKNERKNCKYSRKHKSHYITVVCDYKGERVKLFYIKYRNNKNWNLLLTTDLSLDFCKALELYQIRWTIEVLFKECKQYLRLGACQSTDFDGQIADVTLTFVTLIILSLQRRFTAYETMGELFREAQKQLLELSLWERILIVFYKMLKQLLDVLNVDVDETIEKILQDKKAGKQLLIILNALDDFEDIDAIYAKSVA